jgi:type III pantothenate kinase
MNTLLIDVGNSRLKWSLAGDSGALPPARAVVHDGDPAAAVAQIEPAAAPAAIRIANVTGPALGTALAAALQARFGIPPLIASVAAEQAGLRSAYADPARLGVDRWLAMLAAWTGAPGASLVVSAGTALTLDVIDASGRHLGGIIAPGLVTAQVAVLGATRFAAAGPQTAFTDGLGTDTEACVRQGALHGCAGLVERLAARYPQARRLLTGGDTASLLPLLAGDWEAAPDLVLEGLRAWRP